MHFPVSKLHLHLYKVVKPVSYAEAGEDPGTLCASLNFLKDLSPETNILWISLESAPNILSLPRCDFLSLLTVVGHCDI